MNLARFRPALIVPILGACAFPFFVFEARAEDEAKPALPPTFIVEAPLPKGFPAPGAIGEVVEKRYPPLRSYSAAGAGAFGDCFGYLSRHKHEMTAPVVMDAAPSQDGPAPGAFGSPIAVERMHFLLESPALDEPKTEGKVTVADMPGLRVMSVAHQGPMSPETAKAAEAKLAGAIKARPELEAAGPLRVLGYNSPFVPRDKQYWEIQTPIREKTDR